MTDERRHAVGEHPRAEQLLLYAEGELSAGQAETVRRHLLSCDECQQLVRDVDSTIVEFRDRQLVVHRHAPPAWATFRPALEDTVRQYATSQRHLWARWAAVLIAAVGGGLIATQLTPRVNAQVLLERSASFERTARRSQQVGIRVHGPLAETLPCAVPAASQTSVQSVGSQSNSPHHVKTAEWSRAQPAPTDRQTVATALDRPAFLCSNAPLSATRFQAWSSRLQRPREHVREESEAIVITIETHEGPVRTATLTIRRDTYQPIAQRLTYSDRSEVEVWVRSNDVPIEPVPMLPRAAESAPAKPPVTAVIAGRELDEIELDVRLQLHQLGADLGEEVHVQRASDGRVVVRGTLQTAERRQQVADALESLPRVATALIAADDPAATARTPAVALPPVPMEPPVLARWLQEEFPSSAEREAYVARVVARSHDVMNRAIALVSLAERYPVEATKRLPARARAKLDRLVSDHQVGLRNASVDLDQLVVPLIREQAPASQTRNASINEAVLDRVEGGDGWQRRASIALGTARQIRQAVLELLTTHDGRVSPRRDDRVTTGRGQTADDSTIDMLPPLVRLQTGLRRLVAK